jgi:lipoyl synthase
MKNIKRLPDYLINPDRSRKDLHELKKRLRRAKLHTVCESAKCPNIVECFRRPQATFMILGDRCQRGCGFCAVISGDPGPVDPNEPFEVAEAAFELGLKHVVVTSVTRDDLPDGGASHFAMVIHALKEKIEGVKTEVLVPDFQGSEDAIRTVIDAGPDVFNHNLETVPRLYETVRKNAEYKRSLDVLRTAKKIIDEMEIQTVTKSGIMVGFGEEKDEVVEVIKYLAGTGCEIITIGQYLQPRKTNLPVARYLEPDEYEDFIEEGKKLGINIFAGPLVRSSYMADEVYGKRGQGEKPD